MAYSELMIEMVDDSRGTIEQKWVCDKTGQDFFLALLDLLSSPITDSR